MPDAADPIDLETAWSALRARAGRGGQACPDLHIAPDGWAGDRPVDADAADLLDALAPVAAAGPRWVVGQLGQTLDGRIATETGHSHTINGHAALVHLHRLRALVDAVLVGVGTVVADQPRLTVRHVPGDDPVRVVLDPRGRAPLDTSPLAAAPGAAATLHLVGPAVGESAAGPHVERATIEVGPDGVEPVAVLEALAARGLRRVLVEGGAVTLSRFIDAGALDRLHLLVAPMLMGSGRCGLALRPIRTVDEALRPTVRRVALGDDTLFDVALSGAYGAGGNDRFDD
ncbi:RibD family protein [Wenzhouxiangella sp. XN79A]|uniref:RibD family protein n=1 Tax=Wenzhouxiangella sp. XN79A TaxID=2724193 RepID=UPI00144A674A|nr:RibD family protein [Wenzhouxiangella sp. XN79A]NKI33980.1 RibD family protein [Wenzhouxiangella sp. XN79A]